ncbi:MAG: hypothetical protein GF355_00375, partial [Candidatus Eisenbacteria bacterium]|nr:hypothetical protein [Candidatus Eisenbacteria bacterium]
MRAAFIPVLLAGLFAGAAAEEPPEERVVSQAVLEVWIAEGADSIAVPHPHVDAGTIALEWRGRRWELRDGLRYDAVHSVLRLPYPAPAGGPAHLTYRHVPLDLPRVWRRRRLVEAAGDDSAHVVAEERGGLRLPAGTQLNISGSKTFSVEMGSRQDLTLDQTLDLTV